jgi:hypothetical protein
MDTSSYIPDLNRLTHNPNDEVRMTSTAFNILLNNISTITKNQSKIDDLSRDICSYTKQNYYLIQKVQQIISSLTPEKRPKFGTKSNLIPNVFRSKLNWSPERYDEELSKAPKNFLTPVPDFNHIMNKMRSIIFSKQNTPI